MTKQVATMLLRYDSRLFECQKGWLVPHKTSSFTAFKPKKYFKQNTRNFCVRFTPAPILCHERQTCNKHNDDCYDKNRDSSSKISVNSQSKRGFTLVELIVSMSLFIIVVFIVTSAFLNVSNLYRKSETTREVMDNLNVAVENITRALRTGTTYNCGADQQYVVDNGGYGVGAVLTPRDCSSGANAISFVSSGGRIGTYQLSIPANWQIDEGILYPYISDVPPGGTCCEWLTDPVGVYITRLRFYVTGTEGVGPEQPRVNIVIQGYGADDPDKTNFSVYTSITQRTPKN